MKLVIDANIIISAMLKDNLVRELITRDEFDFVTPEFIIEEINKYKEYIKEKANLDEIGFKLILTLLFEFIKVIPKEEYELEIDKVKRLMKEDPKDVPYVACYLALNCDGIWTNDNDFKEKDIKLVTTKYLLNLLNGC